MDSLSSMEKQNELEVLQQEYLDTLCEKELKALEIAKTCLGTSFQLEKSNGFLKWLENKKKNNP